MNAQKTYDDSKLSVIVPFYCTRESLFTRCMESLLAEPTPAIEILVLDDGSPAEHAATVDRYGSRDRVRVFHLPHGGVSAARNRGIAEAAARWITFVDSDDYVDSRTLQKIMNEIDSYEGDVHLFGGGFDSMGSVQYNTTFLQEGHDYGKDEQGKIAIMESALAIGVLPETCIQRFSYGAPYCKLFRRDFLIDNGLRFDEGVRFAEDTLFSLGVYRAAASIFYHEDTLYFYVNNSDSVTRRFRPGISKDMDIFFERVRAFLDDARLFAPLERAYYLRAQLEAGRAFTREFFNPNNTDPDRGQKYRAFIRQEPYRTAFEKNYLPGKNMRYRVYKLLVRHGCGTLYRIGLKLI